MVDAFVMFGLGNRIIPEPVRTLLGYQAVIAGTAFLLAVEFWTEPIVLCSLLVAAILICCVMFMWCAQRQAAVDRLLSASDGKRA